MAKELKLEDIQKSIDYIEYLLKKSGSKTGDVTPVLDSLRNINSTLKVISGKEEVRVDTTGIEEGLKNLRQDLKKKEAVSLEKAEKTLSEILKAIKENAPEKIGEKIDAMDEVFRGLKPKDSVRFDDDQMKNLMAALTNQGQGIGGGGIVGIADEDGNVISPATNDKIPSNDLYISYNGDGTINTKVWKKAGTATVIKTLTYNYSGGVLISKTLS